MGGSRPLVIAVVGAPASGKTHLSRLLAAALGFSHISADVVRKQLSASDPGQRGAPDNFGAAFRNATYGELARRAAVELAKGRGAVIDAAFGRRGDREAFANALDAAAQVAYVECMAPAKILAERGSRRDRFPWRASAASLGMVHRALAAREPLDEIPPERRLTVRTDRCAEEVVADVLAMLGQRARPH